MKTTETRLAARVREIFVSAGEQGLTTSELIKRMPKVPEVDVTRALASNKNNGFIIQSGKARASLTRPEMQSNVYILAANPKQLVARGSRKIKATQKISPRAALEITAAITVLQKYGIEVR